jgi:photosystem II stability/assembly factor-like uncharacterized protein
LRNPALARFALLLALCLLFPAASRAERDRNADARAARERPAVPSLRDGLEKDSEPPPQRLSREELLARAHAVPERSPIGPQIDGFSPSTLQWTALGPKPIADEYWSGNDHAAGRVSSISVDPRDANVVYVAAAQGGVWKSLDGGATWKAITDKLSSLASGALACDPANPDILYYATGEQHEALDSFAGDGLFRSLDAGMTWTKIATRASIGDFVARVAVNLANPNLLYLASSRGLLRSTDGGTNWTVTQSGNWGYDLVLHPTDSTILYGAVYGLGVYKSINSGATWTRLTGGFPAPGSFQRLQIALARSNPLVLYASLVSPSGTLAGMYRTTDGGTSWTRLSATPDYLNGQGWYDNCLTVDPTNENVCYAGGLFPYDVGYHGIIRTTNGGASWTDITIANDGTQVHPDQHTFAWGPDGTLWLGNDGGVWKTPSPGATWTNRNDGLEITQFYTVGLHPSDPNQILGGTQDNGSVRYDGNPEWFQAVSGDGGPVLYQLDNPNLYYTTYIFMDPVFKFDSGAFVDIVTGGWSNLDRADWANGPLISDPNAPNTILAGTYRVWQTNDGGVSWSPISGDLTNGGVLLSIAAIAGSPGTYYAAASDGRVSYTNNSGVTWVPRGAGLPGFPIHRIVPKPGAPLTAYLCSANAFGAQVWKTIDGGATWMNISGDLPGVVGLALTVDFTPSTPVLYLGTDNGIFSSQDDGAEWVKETHGIPSCPVLDLAFDPVNRYVVAATHGRGMYRAFAPTTGVVDRAPGIATLRPIVPNPGHPPFQIDFELSRTSEIVLEVYDLAGRRVSELASGSRTAGRYQATWNGMDAAGHPLGDGIYFTRLRTGGRTESRRLVLLR